MSKSTGEYCMVSRKIFDREKENEKIKKVTQEYECVNLPKKTNDEIHIQMTEDDHRLVEEYADKHQVSLNEAYNAVISHSLELFRKVHNYVSTIQSL